jgi:hypothetical protein
MKLGDITVLRSSESYLQWSRGFEQFAKANGFCDIMRGTEAIIPYEPLLSDHYIFTDGSRSLDGTGAAGKSLDTMLTMLSFNRAHSSYDRQQWKISRLRWALYFTVSESVARDFEVMTPPNDLAAIFSYIHAKYGVCDGVERSLLLAEASSMHLSDFQSVKTFVRRHRQLQRDIVRAGQPSYDDAAMIGCMWQGLPEEYHSFLLRNGPDKPDPPPSLDTFVAALFIKEKQLQRARSADKVEARHSISFGTSENTLDVPRVTDRPPKVCTVPGCGKAGHREAYCWLKYPELKAKYLTRKARYLAQTNRTDGEH